jgi:hypothetical protein
MELVNTIKPIPVAAQLSVVTTGARGSNLGQCTDICVYSHHIAHCLFELGVVPCAATPFQIKCSRVKLISGCERGREIDR